MTTTEIAEKLNSLAKSENFEIANLPELRKKKLGKKNFPNKIFTKQTIFERYAFHHGGRAELQFNMGSEDPYGIIDTRYVLCFSLEPSQSFPNLLNVLQNIKQRFNECIVNYPELFTGMKMWYHQNGNRYGNFPPRQIPDEWFKEGSFIAIGYLIEKNLTDLNEADLIEILKGFDKLLPIYQYCVLSSKPTQKAEIRIARICWNTNNWSEPSGRYGKSKQSSSHENERVYGHEEWLFDFNKIINGFHYSLIQPAQKRRINFLNNYYNVRLFSRNSETSENFWVGQINHLEVISYDEANEIYSIYSENGWLDEMAGQIKSIKGDVDHFWNLAPHDVFNIRFKPQNAILFNNNLPVEHFETEIGTYHYQFIKERPSSPDPIQSKPKRNFVFSHESFKKSLTRRISFRKQKAVQSIPVHDKIQEILYNHLVKKYGKKKVGVETNTGLSTRIDVSVNSPEGIILYEVKSYASLMISIRIALGQLMEYAYFPNPIENLRELVIVSHIPIDEECKEYLEFIRTKTSLNIFYQSVDIDKKTLSSKY